jgi:predicted O-methyltransferase YrrM
MHHSTFIGYIADIYKPSVYVELGLYEGETLLKVLPHAKEIYGVDIKSNSFLENIAKNNKNVNIIYDFTDNFFLNFNKGIDMAFIDADHNYKSAIKDFENILKLLNPGGIILIHDTDPKDDYLINPGYCGDSYKIVDILEKNNDINIFTFPITEAGLSIIQKKNNTRTQLRKL